MKLNNLIQSGIINRPKGMFWYGLEGTRKTGTAVKFPNVLILDMENGSHQYDCQRITIANYPQLIQALDLVINEEHDRETIVLDGLEWVEKLIAADTCQTLKIDGLHGLAHGAAWTFFRENFDLKIMARLNALLRRGLNAVVIGHAQVRTIQLPGSWEAFERFEPRLDRRNADSLVEWSDATLFFDWDLRTAKNRDGVVRAIAGHEPVIQVTHGPGWIAKNRSGLTGTLKCEYASIASMLQSAAPAEVAPPSDTAVAPPATPHSAADSRTDQAPPPNPDEEFVEPFLSDQERQALDALLSSFPQEPLLAFLRERDLIHADEDYHMLGPTYSRRILTDPEGFKKVVGGA